MKRLTLCLVLAVALLAGCKQGNKDFTTHTLSGERCYLQIFDEPFILDFDTVSTKITYSVVWPDKGVASQAALRELQYLYFGDSSVSVKEAQKVWLNRVFFYDDEKYKIQDVKSIDEDNPYSYYFLESSCEQDSHLAVVTVKSEIYPYGAAHGLYAVDYLTIDKETGNVIHLADLVADTNLLCEAIAHAIQDLDVNNDTRECLFDEFIGVNRMPLPQNFVFDSTRSNILVEYGLYEITPYCCGIQSVVLPVQWLSEQVALTPCAKRILCNK